MKCSLVVIVLLALILSSPLSAKIKDKGLLVDSVLALSGLKEQTVGIDKAMNTNIGNQLANSDLKQKQREDIKRVILKHVSGKKLFDKVILKLIEKLSTKELESIKKRMTSKLVKRIKLAEKEAKSVKGVQELTKYMESMQKNPPAQTRFMLAEELDRAFRITKISALVASETTRGILIGINQNNPKKKLSEKDIAESVNVMRSQMEGQLIQVIMLSLVYTYRNFKDGELHKYIEIIKSKEFKKFYGLYFDVIKEYFTDAGKRMGGDFQALVKNQSKGSKTLKK